MEECGPGRIITEFFKAGNPCYCWVLEISLLSRLCFYSPNLPHTIVFSIAYYVVPTPTRHYKRESIKLAGTEWIPAGMTDWSEYDLIGSNKNEDSGEKH